MHISKFDIPRPQLGDLDPESAQWIYSVDGQTMKWSNAEPLPHLGDKINITMNGIGRAIVIGYFYESVDDGAWIGLMTLPLNPPKWLKDQIGKGARNLEKPLWWRAGVGCTYGMECEV